MGILSSTFFRPIVENNIPVLRLMTLEFHPRHLSSEFNSVPDPYHLGTDPDPWIRKFDLRILLFSSMTAKMPTKKSFFLIFFSFYFL